MIPSDDHQTPSALLITPSPTGHLGGDLLVDGLLCAINGELFSPSHPLSPLPDRRGNVVGHVDEDLSQDAGVVVEVVVLHLEQGERPELLQLAGEALPGQTSPTAEEPAEGEHLKEETSGGPSRQGDTYSSRQSGDGDS